MITINDFDEDIKQKAELELKKIKKKTDLNWATKLSIFQDMKIFHGCNYAIWLPKKEFLKRLVNIRPLARSLKSNEPLDSMLTTIFNKLNDISFAIDNVEPRVQQLHRITNILAVRDFRKLGIEWFENNGELAGFGLLQCLTHENMYLVTECCYVSAYIIHFLKSQTPYLTSQAIIKGCVDIISMRVMDQEEYVENYRMERLKHDDLELFAGKELPFHWPKFFCQSNCREYCAISCAIYTLAFVFQYNQYPRLILFFQRTILSRREIVRYLLFKLHIGILRNIDKTLIENNHDWKKLTVKLYTEIGNSPSEKNPSNKKLISEIVHYLQDLYGLRLPPFASNTYQTVEHFKVTIPESRSNIDKAGLGKSSIRLVLKGNTSKLEKETADNTTEHSLTDDSDFQFKENSIFLRKSLTGDLNNLGPSERGVFPSIQDKRNQKQLKSYQSTDKI